MKFAKQLESEAESIPSEWRPYLIQYKALKKLISKVAEEIESRGLSSELLHECLIYEDNNNNVEVENNNSSNSSDNIPRIKYYFTGEPPNIKPNIEFVYDPTEPQVRQVLSKLFENETDKDDAYSSSSDNSNNASNGNNNKARRRSSTLLAYKRTSNNKDFFTLTSRSNSNIDGAKDDSELQDENGSIALETPAVQKQNRRDSTVLLVKELLHVTLAAKSSNSCSSRDRIDDTGKDEPQEDYSKNDESNNSERESSTHRKLKTLVIELEQDDEFFKMLMEELQQAVSLQDSTTEKFKEDINELETRMTKVTSPTTRKTDMYNWRYILSLYMDAHIFQQLHAVSAHNATNSSAKNVAALTKAKQQMTWFMEQLKTQHLVDKLKTKESKEAFEQFISLNTQLITMKHYQLLNETAMRKILKKHDKRSGLTASQSFPDFIFSGIRSNSNIINSNSNNNILFNPKLANMLYAIITEKLTTVIPQPEDYACPVCMSVAWRPIRLECQHVFCVRCLIKAQRKQMNSCPLCRHPTAVGSATALNLDEGLQNFLKLYFPREIKEKKRENEREQAMEDIQAMTGKRYTEEQLMRMNRQYNSHNSSANNRHNGGIHHHPFDQMKCHIM